VQLAPEKNTVHRALDDIRESIAELRHYRTTFFRLPEPAAAQPARGTTAT
jgi:oligoribonuclease (3'-5' exoribonuclease)